METEKELFLKVSKNRYFDNKDLSPIDMLILSQIEEFERNEKSCFMASKTFASNFNVSVETINRSIKKLVGMQYISSTSHTEHKDGKIQTIRKLSIIKNKTSNQNNISQIDNSQDENVSCQNDELLTCQNDSLKDNYILKDNLKENIKDNNNNEQIEKDKYTENGIRIPKIETEEFVITRQPRKSLVSSLLGE